MKLPSLFQRVSLLSVIWLLLTNGASAEEKQKVVKAPKMPVSTVSTDFSELPEGWLVGLDRAKRLAADTKRDLFLSFAATDWIPPSIDLEDKVFTRTAFVDAASEHFVLVRLDFPRKRHVQSEDLQKTNMKANLDYYVSAYPTIILADYLGRPYAQTGWRSGELNAETYLKHVMTLREKRLARDRSLQAAEQSVGIEKAKHLSAALKSVDPKLVLRFYDPEFRQVLEVDPDNAAGLGSVLFFERKTKLKIKLNGLAEKKQWEEALTELETFSGKFAKSEEQKQEIAFFKLGSLMQLGRHTEVMIVLDRVIAMAPTSNVGKQAKGLKPELAKQIRIIKERERKANPGVKPKVKLSTPKRLKPKADGKGQSPFKARRKSK
jgi:hypothetical protein